MSQAFLGLCANPKIVDRDGGTGAFAHLMLPFHGYWFASGQIPTFPKSTIPQSTGRTLVGRNIPTFYSKDCCVDCGGVALAPE